jgi:hypothetical protein
LSFHRVREAIASGVYVFTHIPGEINPADILSKHWGYSSVWHMLKTIMFVCGETIHSPGRSDFQKDNTSGELQDQDAGCSSRSGSINDSVMKVGMKVPKDTINTGIIPTMRFPTGKNQEPDLRVTRVSWFDLDSNRSASATYGIGGKESIRSSHPKKGPTDRSVNNPGSGKPLYAEFHRARAHNVLIDRVNLDDDDVSLGDENVTDENAEFTSNEKCE